MKFRRLSPPLALILGGNLIIGPTAFSTESLALIHSGNMSTPRTKFSPNATPRHNPDPKALTESLETFPKDNMNAPGGKAEMQSQATSVNPLAPLEPSSFQEPLPHQPLPVPGETTPPHPTATSMTSISTPAPVIPRAELRQMMVEQQAPRPRWRIILGSVMIGASIIPLGFGGRALYLDNRCIDTPVYPASKCTQVFDTKPLGIGLTIAGSLLAVGGVLMIAIPGKKLPPRLEPYSSESSASLGRKTQAALDSKIEFGILPQGAFLSYHREF